MLLREGRAALDAVAAAERRTQRAGATNGDPRLVLVTKAGASSELLDSYAAEPDAAPVEVLLCGPGEQERLLRTAQADAAPYCSVARTALLPVLLCCPYCSVARTALLPVFLGLLPVAVLLHLTALVVGRTVLIGR